MKILVVLPRFPYPLDKGDKLRAYNQIRCLSQNNEIYLFCITHEKISDGEFEKVGRFCKKTEIVHCSKIATLYGLFKSLVTVNSLQIGYWVTSKAMKKYRRFEKSVNPDVVYCQMVRVMNLVKKSKCPKVIDFQDSLSKNTERRMSSSKGIWKHVLHYEFKMLRSCEYTAFDIFDEMAIISKPDRDAIPHPYSDTIEILPNGIDAEYFKPMEVEKDYDIVFCGNMHYVPNVDAAKFLVKEIMPLVWEKHPDAKVLISGINPDSSVKRLENGNVTVSGWVEDIRQSYSRSRIFVAPMRLGSGLQNKLLEAMAMRIPCVTTPLANSSLGAEDGAQILVAETAEKLANNILRLLENPQLSQDIAQCGHEYVTSNFSWENNSRTILEPLLRKAIAKKSRGEFPHSTRLRR